MNEGISIDDSFSRDYECQVLTELPAIARNHYYFPDVGNDGGKDGLMVKIISDECKSWTGTFASGTNTTKGANSGIYSHPDPNTVCVVSSGSAFFVDVCNPMRYQESRVFPVTSVVSVPESELLVLSSQTKLYAYGKLGLVWESKRLAWDELRITDVVGNTINGSVWDIQTEEYIPFHIDLESGEHTGGISMI